MITFFNSICVCVIYRSIENSDITGDRVKYTLVTKFNNDINYKFERKWFSLQFYEDNRTFLDKNLEQMVADLRNVDH